MEEEVKNEAADELFDGGWESETLDSAAEPQEEPEDDGGGEAAPEESEEAALPEAKETGASVPDVTPASPGEISPAQPYRAPGVRPTDAARKLDFLAFAKEHPEVDAKAIPTEVWKRVAQGESLSSAWARHENAALKLKIQTMEQAELNRARSAGSRQSAGKTRGTDPFDEGWQEI